MYNKEWSLEPFLSMSRPPRTILGDTVYHVINRSNNRVPLFEKEGDYRAFDEVIEEAKERHNMRILAYCTMPNHWHFLLYPRNDGDLPLFMGWLTLTHTQRWRASHNTIGNGHLYQGRYKSFPVQTDDYFLTVCRYVEQNPLRAGLVTNALDWRWGSLWRREYGTLEQTLLLDEWPTPKPSYYLSFVNELEHASHLTSIRTSVNKGQPFGKSDWVRTITKKLGLESTFYNPGRPKNGSRDHF